MYLCQGQTLYRKASEGNSLFFRSVSFQTKSVCLRETQWGALSLPADNLTGSRTFLAWEEKGKGNNKGNT